MRVSDDDSVEERPLKPRYRPLIPVVAGLALGIAADGVLEPSLGSWLLVGGIAAVLVFLAARGAMPVWVNWAAACLLVFPVGGAYHHFRSADKGPHHLVNLPVRSEHLYHLRGVVRAGPSFHRRSRLLKPEKEEEPKQGFWSLRIELDGISGDGNTWRPAEGGVTVFAVCRPELLPGDRVSWLGRLRPGRAPTNPGESDRRKAYQRQGSYATSSVDGPEAFALLRGPAWYTSLTTAVGRLRGFVKRRLLWEADAPVSGLTAALVFGERGWISQYRRDLLQRCGAYHFLAVSGLHVGIFAAFCWALLMGVGLPVGMRSALLLALVWLYVLFTGAHAAAARAGLMVTFMVAAPLLGRQRDFASALAGTALVLLLWRPQYLFSAGFQLTFIAVWAIVYLYRQFAAILWPWEDVVVRLQRSGEHRVLADLLFFGKHYLLLSFCVWIATAPMIAYWFKIVSPLAPVVNLFLYPLVVPLIVSSFLLVGSVCVGLPGSGLLVWCTNLLSDSIGEALEVAGSVVLHTPGPWIWWIVLFYVCLCVWVLRARLKQGRKAFLVVALVLAATHVWGEVAVHRKGPFTLTVCDVGEAQLVLMRFPSGCTMLYDAGCSSVSRARVVADVLWHQRVRRIDTIVLSHRNWDHYIALPFLVERFSVGKVVIPPAGELSEGARRLREFLAGSGVRVLKLTEGAGIRGRGFECSVLHPSERFIRSAKVNENDKSMVLLCRSGDFRFLLTGDVCEVSMKRLVERYGETLDVDLLILPHHGRYEPGLEEFVRRARPAVAIASGGHRGGLGGTRDLLRRLEVPLWTTAESGAVIVEYLGDTIVTTGYVSDRTARYEVRRNAYRDEAQGSQ